MIYIKDLIKKTIEEGYEDENADSKVCQDIVLHAIASSSLKNHVTIKGGVVMRSISHNIRRATHDIDIDFIRYSLSDESIIRFVDELNGIDGLRFSISGKIEELKQQDYHGKRIYVRIKDSHGDFVESKIDFGVHKDLNIDQIEYCFDICLNDDGVYLLMNSMEQMFTEKLRSLLKFGMFSRRYKDIFDMYFLIDKMNKDRLMKCFEKYIFLDEGMRENNMDDIIRRVNNTFKNKTYKNTLKTSRRNWVNENIDVVLTSILHFLYSLNVSTITN